MGAGVYLQDKECDSLPEYYFGTGLDYSEKINPFDEFGLKMATYWREKEFYLVEYIGNKKQIIQISKIIKEITNVTLPEQREKIAHRCSY